MKKRHLIAFIIEVSLLMLLVIAIVIGAYIEDRVLTVNYIYNQTGRISSATSSRVSNFINDNIEEVSMLAYLYGQELSNDGSNAKLLNGLESVETSSLFIYVDKNGMSYSMDGNNIDVSDRDYYQKGIAGEKGVAVIYESKRDGEEYIVYYAPVYVNGEISGVLAELSPADELADILGEESSGNPNTALIVDKYGIVIVKNVANKEYDFISVGDLLQIVDDTDKNSILNAINNRTKGEFKFEGVMGKTHGFVVPIGNTDWCLVEPFPTDVIYRSLSNDNRQPVIVFAGIGGFFILFTICFVFTIMKETGKSHKNDMRQQMNIILRSVSGEYVYLLDVDMNTLEEIRYELKRDSEASEWENQKSDYGEAIKRYAQKNVAEYDRDRFIKETKIENLVEKLRNTNDYFLEYDVVERGKIKRFQAKFIIDNTKPNKPHMLVSVRDITAITNERYEVQLQKKLIVAAACSVYPFIIEENITQNTYKIMYNYGEVRKNLYEEGTLEECMTRVSKTIPDPDERNEFAEIFDRRNILDAFNRGKRMIEYRYKQVTEEGKLHWSETKLILMEGEDENVVGVSLTRKIDDEIQRELELSEAKSVAEEADKIKSRYLFGISHEIRTPLNALMGYTSLARKNIEDKESLEEYLNKAEISQRNLIRIVDGMLDIVAIENEELILDEKPTDASWAIDKILTLVGPEGKEKGITFETSSDFYNPYIYQDMIKNAKIVYNLLSLAIDNSEENGTICFSLNQIKSGTSDDDCMVEFNCSYKGEMIYKTGDNKGQEEGEKDNNKLLVANKFIEIMGGSIYIQEENGNVNITTRTPHKLAIAEEIDGNIDLTIIQKRIKGKRILIADADASIREITDTILVESGMIVETMATGQEVIDRLSENKEEFYDVLMIDNDITDVDIYNLVKIIKDHDQEVVRKVPIIMVANGIMKEEVRKANSNGINNIINKPIETQLLLETIAKLVK